KNQTPRPATGPKEDKGRKYGGRIGKAVVGATLGAAGGFAGAAAGAAGGPIGSTAASTAGVVAGVYLGTRGGQRVGQKIGGRIGRHYDKKDARLAASGVDPSAKKPGFFSRLTDKFKGKSTSNQSPPRTPTSPTRGKLGEMLGMRKSGAQKQKKD
ncbi:unnamed protein product, partial [Aphanomyces euteiches]